MKIIYVKRIAIEIAISIDNSYMKPYFRLTLAFLFEGSYVARYREIDLKVASACRAGQGRENRC